MALDARTLATQFLGEDWSEVLVSCSNDPGLAGHVSQDVAEALLEQAAAFPTTREKADAAWLGVQDRIVDLARLPGVEELELANAFFDAATGQVVIGGGNVGIESSPLRWLIEVLPDRIEAIVAFGDYTGPDAIAPLPQSASRSGMRDHRPILEGLWALPGDEGASWLVRINSAAPGFLNDQIQVMASGGCEPWSPAKWNDVLARIVEECEQLPEFLGFIQLAHPPAETCPAQVRLVCRFATGAADPLLRNVAENLDSYRSDDPDRDAGLFWWPGAEDVPETFRDLLQLFGSPSYRERLIGVARDQGFIDKNRAEWLLSEALRPAQLDSVKAEAPWAAAERIMAGLVRVPDGQIAGGSPWATPEEAPAFAFAAEPGDYEVWLTIATHPLYGSQNAVAELRVAHYEISEWTPLSARLYGPDGYVAEAGVASFGAAEALKAYIDELPEILNPQPAEARHAVLESDPVLGSIIGFTVGPQDQQCRSWLGLDAHGRAAALVTDLGLLDDPLSMRFEPGDDG